MGDTQKAKALGSLAVWGSVGYEGRVWAPVAGSYAGVDATQLNYTTTADSGSHPRSGSGLANLFPLVAAALYEVGFANELGALSTWSN